MIKEEQQCTHFIYIRGARYFIKIKATFLINLVFHTSNIPLKTKPV